MVSVLVRAFLLLCCSTVLAVAEPSDPARKAREGLQAELEDFSKAWDRRTPDWDQTTEHFVPLAGPAVSAYRDRLKAVGSWEGGPVWHQVGTLGLTRPGRADERLGINVFFPAGPSRGTLLFVHGYLSHAANFAYTYAWFTNHGWTVTTLDLPGHGLSTGPRGDVETFADYGDAVARWLDWQAAQGWPGPRLLAAHSLGSAAVLEALRRPGVRAPDQVVFCAPLLRTRWYPFLPLAAAVSRPWMESFPQSFGWDHYLDGGTIPLHWYDALGRWLESLEDQKPMTWPLTVVYGSRDEVVDADWNLAELRRLVPDLKEIRLEGKGHLFLSDDADRKEFAETWSRWVLDLKRAGEP
jgi:alpha-beta hydrolase superfamily lysophospholipase